MGTRRGIYELIWKRAIASQMADARLLRTTVEITARAADGTPSMFSATGKAIQFAGLSARLRRGQRRSGRRARRPGNDSADDDGAASAVEAPTDGGRDGADARRARAEGTRDHAAGALHRRVAREAARRRGHRTAVDLRVDHRDDPAPRLRVPPGQGAGAELHRVCRDRSAARHFSDYVDRGFTAEMEEDLDQVANGERTSLDFVREFYRGSTGRPGLEQRVSRRREHQLSGRRARHRRGRLECRCACASAATARSCSAARAVRATRRRCPRISRRPTSPSSRRVELLKAKAEGPRALGADPATGKTVYVMNGRFGAYVQLGETPDEGREGQAKARRSRSARRCRPTSPKRR